MEYDEFDIGNFEDPLCIKILKALKDKPKNIYELSKTIFNYNSSGYKISPKLQKMKKLGMVSNVKDKDNVCYWGLLKKYRSDNI